MKLILILLSFLILPNVNGQIRKKGTLQADSLQVFFTNGWNFSAAIKIDSKGVRIFNSSGHKDYLDTLNTSKCYLDTLNISDTDIINRFLLKIRSEKIDTLYDGHCEDCGFYFIKINFEDTVIRAQIIGEFDNDIVNLSKYVLKIKPIEKNLGSSSVNYEAKKLMEPPPPPDLNFYHLQEKSGDL